MRKNIIEVGYLDIPKDYLKYTKTQKRLVCESIIDKLLIYLEGELNPHYNRIEFLKEIFEVSMMTNVENEQYEVAAVIKDCIKLLNED